MVMLIKLEIETNLQKEIDKFSNINKKRLSYSHLVLKQ
ncbi:hypothetical protein SR187_5880 [Streptococcus ruminantium]|uniref:Uncharacterized protein n=1 Tax=Streptococcus ruminantium TaxID=1917441 RepID=A0A2Z5TZR8_9STRE|nr:hypothetical protein SR187_5880 [Streptococcus ruminantium]